MNDDTAVAEQSRVLAPTDTNKPLAPSQVNMSADVLSMLMARALRNPRDLNLVQARAFEELAIVPELAARSYYSIPYNQGKQNETLVEGPSIKAAMTLARNWGNNFNQGRFSDEDKSNVVCQGIFVDFETGGLTLRDIKVSKFYKPRGMQSVIPCPADMMYNRTQAGISKAVRNAILASLPDFLVYGYFQKAKQIVVAPPKSKDNQPVASLEDRILKAKQAICKFFKVTPEEMEAYLIDNADSIEDPGSLLVHLQGLYNSLKDGQYRPDEVFRPGKAKEPAPMPSEGK